MQNKKVIQKNLINTRLLKNYGSWIYCISCNKTVGYLCYTTYDYFKYDFTCRCGNKGVVEIKVEGIVESKKSDTPLILNKNRYCCPIDDSPLFSVVDKSVKEYRYELICKKCKNIYQENYLTRNRGRNG